LVTHPQSDLTAIELAKLPHFERNLLDGSDIDLNLAAFDEHAEPDPVGRHDRRIDGALELLGKLVAKVLKIKLRQRDVLDRVLLARDLDLVVLAMKGDSDIALLQRFLATDRLPHVDPHHPRL
jgi:hypothetical protein